jgi:hypothetical protein
MHIEQVAKMMRERALLIEGDDSLSEKLALNYWQVEREKERKRKRVEDMKKLYFNAGRWVGGARDHVAREAFFKMRELEQ